MYSVHIVSSYEKSTRSSQPSLLAKTLVEVSELVVQHFNFKYCTSWDLRSAYRLKFCLF